MAQVRAIECGSKSLEWTSFAPKGSEMKNTEDRKVTFTFRVLKCNNGKSSSIEHVFFGIGISKPLR